jgi:hypothetical protein
VEIVIVSAKTPIKIRRKRSSSSIGLLRALFAERLTIGLEPHLYLFAVAQQLQFGALAGPRRQLNIKIDALEATDARHGGRHHLTLLECQRTALLSGAPPRWAPPKRRGRMSEAMKLKIIQWCT